VTKTALSIQQKSPVQISGIFAGRMERVRPLPRLFEATCFATQGMLGDQTLLCLKMVDFLKIFAALEQHDCETISCTILYRNDDGCNCLLHAEGISKLELRSDYSRAFVGGREEFEHHFRMTRETCQLLTQEIMHTGWIPTGNLSGQPAILPDK